MKHALITEITICRYDTTRELETRLYHGHGAPVYLYALYPGIVGSKLELKMKDIAKKVGGDVSALAG